MILDRTPAVSQPPMSETNKYIGRELTKHFRNQCAYGKVVTEKQAQMALSKGMVQ